MRKLLFFSLCALFINAQAQGIGTLNATADNEANTNERHIYRGIVDVIRLHAKPQMQIFNDNTKLFADLGVQWFSKSELNQSNIQGTIGFEHQRNNSVLRMSYGREFFPVLEAHRVHIGAIVQTSLLSNRLHLEFGYMRFDPLGPIAGIQFNTDRQGPIEDAPAAGNREKVVPMYTSGRDVFIANITFDILKTTDVRITARAGTFVDENKQAVSFSSDGRLVMSKNVGPTVKLTAVGRLNSNMDLKVFGLYNSPIPTIVSERNQRTVWGADVGKPIPPTRLTGQSVTVGATIAWRINPNLLSNRRIHVPINIRGTKQHFLQDRTCHRPQSL